MESLNNGSLNHQEIIKPSDEVALSIKDLKPLLHYLEFNRLYYCYDSDSKSYVLNNPVEIQKDDFKHFPFDLYEGPSTWTDEQFLYGNTKNQHYLFPLGFISNELKNWRYSYIDRKQPSAKELILIYRKKNHRIIIYKPIYIVFPNTVQLISYVLTTISEIKKRYPDHVIM